MTSPARISRDFFTRPTLQVVRELLGKRLVRMEGNERIAGIIVEAEAYIHQEDLGCHASAGLTPRTRVLFGPPGRTYVYFTYGNYWMLNFVTEPEGTPAAVLIRGIVPTEGLERITARRAGRPEKQWTDGPGKLCVALAIGKAQNDLDMCAEDAEIFVEQGVEIPDSSVTIGPRVGLNSVPEPWKSIPWRFLAKYEI